MSAAEEAARMPTRTKKHVVQKIVLRLPDLDHAKSSVLNSASSPRSRRNYKFAMEQFITWYCSEPRLALKGVKQLGCRAGNWLNREQARLLLEKSNGEGLRSIRDVAKHRAYAPDD
jgi:hypothetical protein